MFLANNSKIEQVIDFGGYKVFEATVDTCILIYKKSYIQSIIKAVSIKDDFVIGNLNRYIQEKNLNVKQSSLTESGWLIADNKTINLKNKISSKGKKIKDYHDKYICFGIKSGLNEAFIITKNQKDKFDKKSQELIKPLIRGRDISKYNIQFPQLYIILTKIGINIEDYPQIKEYLKSYKDKFSVYM
jgi:membrane-bound inhibitor of C-type lysozyme